MRRTAGWLLIRWSRAAGGWQRVTVPVQSPGRLCGPLSLLVCIPSLPSFAPKPTITVMHCKHNPTSLCRSRATDCPIRRGPGSSPAPHSFVNLVTGHVCHRWQPRHFYSSLPGLDLAQVKFSSRALLGAGTKAGTSQQTGTVRPVLVFCTKGSLPAPQQ